MYLQLKWRYWKKIFAAKNSGFWVGKYRRNKLIGEKMEHLPAELADLRCSGNWWAMQYIARKKERKRITAEEPSPLSIQTLPLFFISDCLLHYSQLKGHLCSHECLLTLMQSIGITCELFVLNACLNFGP